MEKWDMGYGHDEGKTVEDNRKRTGAHLTIGL